MGRRKIGGGVPGISPWTGRTAGGYLQERGGSLHIPWAYVGVCVCVCVGGGNCTLLRKWWLCIGGGIRKRMPVYRGHERDWKEGGGGMSGAGEGGGRKGLHA